MALRQDVDLVVDLQLAGGVHERLVTEAVERLRVTGRGHDRRATHQLAGGSVFKDEKVAFLAIEADFGGKRGFGRGDLVAQAFDIVGQ